MSALTPTLSWTSSATGHVYNYFESLKSWNEASAYALSIGGYLAKVDFFTEGSDIFSRVSSEFSTADANISYAPDGGSAAYIWLGASDAQAEGTWIWARDETEIDIVSSWGSGALGSEPDNAGNQDYLALGMENWPYGSESGAGYGNAGQWNDVGGSNLLYFLVEFDAVPDLTTTSGADLVVGSTQDESVEAGAGNDTIYAAGGSDTVDGGSGFDSLHLDGSAWVNGYDIQSGYYTYQRDDGVSESVTFRGIEEINIFGLSYLLSDFDSNVHRFYNTATGAHFYSNNAEEATSVYNNLPQYVYEGVAFSQLNMYENVLANPVDVYRFYNTTTGTHFYTANAVEAALVRATLPALTDEGVAYVASAVAEDWLSPIYRFYNTSTGSHFYTANSEEADSVRATMAGVLNYEGIAYYVM